MDNIDETRRGIIVDLVEDEDSELSTIEELARQGIGIGEMYLSLVRSSGWKHLQDTFFKKELQPDNFLNAKDDEARIRAQERVRVLRDLEGHIQGYIRNLGLSQRVLDRIEEMEEPNGR